MLSNKPTVGADNDTWGQELNDSLDELEATKVEVGTVYDKTASDGRYVRTVNGVGPNGSGDVTVAGGGGGSGVDQTARDSAASAFTQASTARDTADAAAVTANAAAAAVQVINDNAGQPLGFATLGVDGQVDPGLLLIALDIVQNANGSWPARPATPFPKQWRMIVASSAAPLGNGTTAGGAGMVPGLDNILDVTGTLGA